MQKENKGFLIKQILLLLWTSDEKLTNLFEKKKVWFFKRNFTVLEKCVTCKILIQILFINGFEVI